MPLLGMSAPPLPRAPSSALCLQTVSPEEASRLRFEPQQLQSAVPPLSVKVFLVYFLRSRASQAAERMPNHFLTYFSASSI